jgi:hypothetical protein
MAECLAERLGGFEPVAVGDRHPPGGDLRRRELADWCVPQLRRSLAEEPAELLDRLGLGVVLAEVHADQLVER